MRVALLNTVKRHLQELRVCGELLTLCGVPVHAGALMVVEHAHVVGQDEPCSCLVKILAPLCLTAATAGCKNETNKAGSEIVKAGNSQHDREVGRGKSALGMADRHGHKHGNRHEQ